jgi:hypothetical protein
MKFRVLVVRAGRYHNVIEIWVPRCTGVQSSRIHLVTQSIGSVHGGTTTLLAHRSCIVIVKLLWIIAARHVHNNILSWLFCSNATQSQNASHMFVVTGCCDKWRSAGGVDPDYSIWWPISYFLFYLDFLCPFSIDRFSIFPSRLQRFIFCHDFTNTCPINNMVILLVEIWKSVSSIAQFSP